MSTTLTPRVPAELTVDCRQCEATHIVETLFRTAVLPAGMTFDPGARAVTFVPIPDWPGVPVETDGASGLVAAYLRLHGPATAAEAAAFLGTRPAELAAAWPDALAEVEIEGRPAHLPAEMADALAAPPDPPELRLLPPSDPYLQARDRELLVPDPGQRKALWPILGRPGAVLLDGEVAGTWRARKKGRRLEVAVEPFVVITASRRRRLEEEADLLARARGLGEASVAVA